jgi:hypothetical protein
LFIADGTPILQAPSDPPLLLPNPNVCVELGYALQAKRPEQLLLAHRERPDLAGTFPFDLSVRHQLPFKGKSDLHKALPDLLDAKLQRFNL